MKRFVMVVGLVAGLSALVGCGVQMGNMKVGVLEGWNQPTVQTEKTEKVTPK